MKNEMKNEGFIKVYSSYDEALQDMKFKEDMVVKPFIQYEWERNFDYSSSYNFIKNELDSRQIPYTMAHFDDHTLYGDDAGQNVIVFCIPIHLEDKFMEGMKAEMQSSIREGDMKITNTPYGDICVLYKWYNFDGIAFYPLKVIS